MMAYTYRTSRGKLCHLHSRLARLPNGRERRYYFFAYRPRPALVEAALPAGYEIVEAYGTGFPALRKRARETTPAALVPASRKGAM